MTHEKPRIVVAGDVCVDWLHWHTPAADEGLNWELCDGSHWATLPGGSFLLAEMLRRAGGVTILAPPSPSLADPFAVSLGQILQSFAELESFPASDLDDSESVYRITRFRGYRCPHWTAPQLLPIEDDDPDAEMVVLDDAGNHFRSMPEFWPSALKNPAAHPLVVYKMARPLLEGALWERVAEFDRDKLVIVLSADHLRAQGVNISRRLSWERTAKDFVWQMAFNPWLAPLAGVRHLIVRFGLEGAIHYASGPARVRSRLFFDPGQTEGGYADCCLGQMQGLSDAFVAALARTLVCELEENADRDAQVGDGILAGLCAARRLLTLGYGNRHNIAQFPSPTIFEHQHDRQNGDFTEVVIPNPEVPEPPDPDYWSILRDVRGMVLAELAEDLVREGKAESLRGVPIAQFGRLRTADRTEIEGFRGIRNLIDEYLHSRATKPLSIAVFGSPGSGKSFSVTQVAESVASHHRIASMEFNLSQLQTPQDLACIFHLVRDKALEGIMPLVFFDEFDCHFGGELGWLKHFLGPMQDGVFRDGGTQHPIGKAIFVFAGGTHDSFQRFAHLHLETDPDLTPEKRNEIKEQFGRVKGPDFVSRLRGYVNILGPNPTSEMDKTYVVRRAMLLRSLIEGIAPGLLDSKGHAVIDDGVLRAFLRVPRYKHGARSMQAILETSMLAGRKRYEPAALPPTEQMALYVDAEAFERLMLRDVLLRGAREILGQAVHEHYMQSQKGEKPAGDPAMRPWEELDEDLRESNMQQADHLMVKLRAVGCSLAPVAAGEEPAPFAFTEDEVNLMAEMEHDRWMVERRLAGWVYGPKRDPDGKVSPSLLPWEELPDSVKQWDRDAVQAIPEIVRLARFEVCRLSQE